MKAIGILFIITLCAHAAACLSDEDTGAVEQHETTRIDCEDRVTNSICLECGNTGTTACCPPNESCYVYCDEWVYDRMGNRHCPGGID